MFRIVERRRLARFRMEQPPYSILDRGIERDMLPTCQRYGMGVMVWSPLSKGILTGTYRMGLADAGFAARGAFQETVLG